MATAASKKVVPIKQPPAPTNEALVKLSQNFAIELRPFPDADAAVAFKHEAAGIVVSDAATHKAALEALRRGKALNRGIEEHWRKVLRWLEDRKKDVRAIMDTDLELVTPGLNTLTNGCLTHERAEAERVRLETERQRKEQERIANEQRQRELADLEAKALEAESSSADLSVREWAFVDAYVFGIGVRGNVTASAERAGYKDAAKRGAILMATAKILNAIDAKRQAIALREQAAAVAEKPVEVTKVEVESQTAKVAGVRTVVTWTGECIDVNALIDAVLCGTADRNLLMANQVEINNKARSLHENLDRIPGLRHVRKETKAG